MKRRKLGLLKRIVSITLAVALVATSVSVAAPEDVQAAAYDATMGTKEVLSETHVKDTKVLQFYRILANMVQTLGAEEAATEVGDKDAQTVIAEYAQYDDDSALGAYLTEYPGKINFGTMQIQYVEGIGWARAAEEIDLSQATFTTPFTKVPDSEFARCTKLKKVLLPATVTEIGNNAFESCQELTTLGIGEAEEGLVDLTNVKTVGASAFSVCTSITDVVFAPYNAQNELKLGSNAFSGCTSITEIEIPIKTAANLGANSFENCSSLAKVGLYDDLDYINNAVFQGTGQRGMLSFYIIDDPDNTVNRLPKNITYIGDNAFKGAIINELDLSECTRLTTLNQYSFGSASLPALTLPESLETIELMAFNGTRLDEESVLVIPEACDDIKTKAFYNCLICAIQLPKSLKKIEDSTFEKSKYLDGERIVIPEGSLLEEIGDSAFADCESLETTEFLKNCTKLTKIGASGFANCFIILEDAKGKEIKTLYGDRNVCDGLRTVVLPDSVVTLGESVFADNYALRSADLGSGVTTIPAKAFYNEEKTSSKSGAALEKVIVSDKLQVIGDSAFENQSRLITIGYTNGTTETVTEGTVQFADGLLSIGASAFSGCGIESSFSLSGMIGYVEKGKVYTEAASGRSELLIYDYDNVDKKDDYCRTVYINTEDLVSTATLAKNGYYDSLLKCLTPEGEEAYEQVFILAKKVYVDDSKLYASIGDASNATKTEVIEIYDEYETLTDAYEGRLYSPLSTLSKYYCDEEDYTTAVSITEEEGKKAVWSKVVSTSEFTNVAVPNCATKSYTANYVFGIQNVIIPDSLVGDKLGEMAFKDCINLNEVKLSEKVTEIKKSTFQGAGKEVTNFCGTGDDYKYYDYYGLKSINIPEGVTVIGDNAFNGCMNLNLSKKGGSSFGTSVTSIGATAFSGCVSLSEVYFPDSLLEIGKEAFSGCALRYKDQGELSYEGDTSTKYKFYINRDKYGTKVEKTGLTVIDFTAALNLEKVGDGAFRMTNVKDVSLVDSPLVTIPNRLFEQCSYLRTIAFQDKTVSIGNDVLKDALSLSGVTWPASATIASDAICGAFGDVYWSSTDPTITFSYDKNEVITVPYGSSIRLPINAINSETRNGDIKISVDTGNGVFESIYNTEVNGLYAECDTESDPYSFVLHGKENIDSPVTVRVEVGTAFAYGDPAISTTACITSHTLEYQVKVASVPTETVSVTAEGDDTVASNPDMYVEEPSKVLYIPAKKNLAEKGITLSAVIEPAETTDEVTWNCDKADCYTINDFTYEKGSGVSTAVLKPQLDASGNPVVGSGKITITSGTKSDSIMVYTVVPILTTGGITCTTSGENIGTDLKANTKDNPYGLELGAKDQIKVSLNYGNTPYTDEQLAEYGEGYIYESSDPTVVEVKADGTINALKAGTAVITVSGQASGNSVQFYFEVGEGLLPDPASVTVAGPNAVNVGNTIALTASVLPERANQEVTWSVVSGQSSISIDENGVVTGLKKGEGKVVATSVENNKVKSAQYTIKVLSPSTEFKMLTPDVTLEVGKTKSISKSTNPAATAGYYLYPTDTTDTITWTSSNEAVATVTGTSSATIKGVAPGQVEIIGTTSSGLEVKLNVNVILKVTKITVDSNATIGIGGTHQLKPVKVPENASEEVTFTYKSSNEKIATVSDTGLITGVAKGTATITVKTNTGKSATCRVTVTGEATPGTTAAPTSTAVPATKLTVLVNKPNAKKFYMAKGQRVTLKTKMEPVGTTDKLTYTSNKTNVATVSSSGMITAKNKGTAKITITATSGLKTTVTVVVSKKQVKAKKVKVKCAKSMKRGKTIKLKVTLKKKSTDTLSFSSNKSAIATVDAYGYVTAKNKKGKVKITVRTSSGKKATKTIKVK